MINRLIYFGYSILLLSFIILLFFYLMNWLEVLETLNKSFFLIGGLIFLSNVLILRKRNKAVQICLNSICFIALLFWIGSLLEFFEFSTYAHLSFKVLISCLITSVFLKYSRGKRTVFYWIYLASFVFLMAVFNLLSYELFSSDIFAISSAALFSILTLSFLFIKKLKA